MNTKIYKIIIIGDSGTGKTCILNRYFDNVYYDSGLSTIGVDFKFVEEFMDHTGVDPLRGTDSVIKLQIWDTAGQERFRTITSSYYRGAHGIIIVYDVTSVESFLNIKTWLNEIRKYTGKIVPIIIVGNKCDSPDRQVSTSRGQKFANDSGYDFIEVSAKEDIRIKDIFRKMIKHFKKKILVDDKPEPLVFSDIKNDFLWFC
jgi:Ras-related protein Rab-1A